MKKSGLERFVPTLVLVSVVLAFAVGVLWQKVSNLENGGSLQGTTDTNTAGTVPAGEQGGPSPLDDLAGVAQKAGVDQDKFESCVTSNKYADKVEAQYQSGVKIGINGTPGTIVLNKKGDAWLVPGAVPIENVKAVIDEALGKGNGTATGKMDAAKASAVAKVTQDDHIKGSLDAPVIMIEYSDYQCPFCQRFHPTASQAYDDYKGQVAWVYRHFPLDQIHPKARPAAIASECVAELGGNNAFWSFTDIVFGG